MDIDANTFKKPQTWALLAPAILFFVAIFYTGSMASARKDATTAVERTQGVAEDLKTIRKILKSAGVDVTGNSTRKPFDVLTSYIECAKAAHITLSNLQRLSGTAPRKLRNGGYEHVLNYKLNSVLMLQIAQFIDYAESNFEAVNCKMLIIVPSPNKKNIDSWDATIELRHVTK